MELQFPTFLGSVNILSPELWHKSRTQLSPLSLCPILSYYYFFNLFLEQHFPNNLFLCDILLSGVMYQWRDKDKSSKYASRYFVHV